jgi:hypothetical protein
MQTTLDQHSAVPAAPNRAATTQGARVLIVLFVLSLLIPSSWEIAGLRFSAARIYALCMVIPLTMRWLAQEAGRPLPVDILILLHGFWIIVSLAVNHGTERFALSVMTVVELFSGYLIGRLLIRNPASFQFLFQVLLVTLAVLLPFALVEMNNGRALLQEVFRGLLGSAHGDVDHPPRWGFYRAQTVMQHPILWGVFCAIIGVNVFYIWRNRLPAAVMRFSIVAAACFSSMSSGAVLNLILQGQLMLWGWATKGAWKVLMLGFLATWILLSVATERGPIRLMIRYFTFNSDTGWGRIHIWNHGIDDALANPIFGIGLHEHTRPEWLTSSVDNFWLLMMMRHGFVGFGLLATALAWHIWKVATAEGLSTYERRLREGYLISLVGLIFSLATVHFWGPPYLLMFAYIGAGVWFYAGRGGMSATATPGISNVEEKVAASASEVAARDLPFARSFAQPKMRRQDLPRTRTSRSIDTLQPFPKAHYRLRGFHRSDKPLERKRQ